MNRTEWEERETAAAIRYKQYLATAESVAEEARGYRRFSKKRRDAMRRSRAIAANGQRIYALTVDHLLRLGIDRPSVHGSSTDPT